MVKEERPAEHCHVSSLLFDVVPEPWPEKQFQRDLTWQLDSSLGCVRNTPVHDSPLAIKVTKSKSQGTCTLVRSGTVTTMTVAWLR